MCYTDKAGSSYYIRQKTSSDGLSWSSPSNVVLVNSSTGNPALLLRDTGTGYLAYRKSSYIYVSSNSGSSWSSPVQTAAISDGDPALLQTETDIIIIYKGTDGHCYRISSVDGTTWSSPSQIAPNKALSDPATVDRKDRFYRITAQYKSASAVDLVRVTEYSYEGNGYLANSTDVSIRDAQTLKSFMHFEYDSKGRTVKTITRNEQGVQTEKIIHTYNNIDKVIRQDVYAGTSTTISYSVILGYDNWGNLVYIKNPEGAEHYYSYGNTNCENQFVDSKGTPVSLFSNAFYSNSIPSECHMLLVGEAFINNGKVQEVYYKYDTNGNLTETKTLFPTRNYAVFSGTFDETGQTTFEFDLTGLTINDGILVISSIAALTQETFHETHSEVGKGWQNTGFWSGKYFMAEYIKCYEPLDCWDGETKIGPFEHYPGTPDCTGYTTWVDNGTQYVQTNYTAIVNEYPEKVDYNLNNSSWIEITENLGSGTTSTTIPASFFIQGLNTLQLQESNTYTTKFEWTLYVDQGATPEEYSTNLTYDTYGKVTSVTDERGNTTLLGYDSHHIYLTSITNALNETITATYEFNTGFLTSITDTKGNITSFEYDITGRVTKKVNPDLSERKAVYDDQNICVTIYDELDHYTICYYDGLDRLIRTERYLSPSTILTETYAYNWLNNLITRTDPGGHVYSYEYDSQGRKTKLINPDSTYREFQYEDISNTVTLFDENQHKKEYHYDWLGNLLWVKEYTDSVNYSLTQYTYNNSGEMTSFTDANGNTTFYKYDSLFGITEITYPDSTTEMLSYDAIGNLIQRTDAQGTTTFTYDPLSQLIKIQYPDHSVSIAYDSNGNRTSMADLSGITSYTYDNRNRCISEIRTIGGQLYTMNYVYDAASRLVSVMYPDQSVVTYEYDSVDRLTAVPGYAEFTYNADSLIASMIYGNDTVIEYQYDNRDRPVFIHAQADDTDLLLLNYQYDPVNNITQLEYSRRSTNQQWLHSLETFHYDWLDRLVTAQGDYGSLSYVYDPVGNRLSQNTLTYTYNNMNELLSINDGTVFMYDGNGNMVEKSNGSDSWLYTYDYSNRLTKVEKNGTTIGEYVYDSDGNRIHVTESSETTTYIYTGLDVMYEENTTGTATYIYGPTGRLAKKTVINGESHTFYYHTDHLGSTRLVTDENKSIVSALTYHPFGRISTEEGSEDYLFTGKEMDATGLYYYGARYYDPDLGRFITRDPLTGEKGNPQSLNRYTYCVNNPVKLVDPTGLLYSMTDSEGNRILISEFGNQGSIVYNSEGKIIYNGIAIQDAIDQGNWVETVKILLEGLQNMEGVDFEISESFSVDLDGKQSWGLVKIKVGDEIIKIFAYGPEMTVQEKLLRRHKKGGLGVFNRDLLTVSIYFEEPCMDAAVLFHIVAHELQHVFHEVEGKWEKWNEDWNRLAADAYDDYLAYRWNYEHLSITGPVSFDFWGNMQMSLKKWGRYKNM